MSSETYISETAALRILMQEGDFAESQARIILGHSLKQDYEGRPYYPMNYIYRRARGHAGRSKRLTSDH